MWIASRLPDQLDTEMVGMPVRRVRISGRLLPHHKSAPEAIADISTDAIGVAIYLESRYAGTPTLFKH